MSKLIKGIAHGAFNVKDMDITVRFYEEVFGFKKAFEMKRPETGEPWIVYIYVGRDQFIELFYGGKNTIPYDDANIGFSHICFEVEDIKAVEQSIIDHGAPLDAEVSFGIDNNWQCWTRDPDGNRIEIMQMGEKSFQNEYIKNHKG